jgi:predicted alpha/beta superfamily hydrolase
MLLRLVVSWFAALALIGPVAPAAAAAEAGYQLPRSAVHEVAAGGRAYKLYVATPPGYAAPENAERRYPVIYLNDGELFFAAAAGEPLLSYYNRVLEETIVVGISYAVDENPLASRQRDLTPAVDAKFKNPTGGAADYLRLIKTGIIPLIEKSYRADPARRTLAGHSLGGTFAAYVLVTEPETFADYIIVSPALWFADHAIAGYESAYSMSHKDLPARVYMAVGDLEGPKGGLKAIDMVNDQIAFASRLRSRGYESFEMRDEILDGGVNHATAFPFAYLRALEWLFPVR